MSLPCYVMGSSELPAPLNPLSTDINHNRQSVQIYIALNILLKRMKMIAIVQDTPSRKIKTWHPCRTGTRIRPPWTVEAQVLQEQKSALRLTVLNNGYHFHPAG